MANQIQIIQYEGYLAADPEMHFTPTTNKEVTNFRIGSGHAYKNSEGNQVKETTWLKITAWGKLGQIVNQYCGKGSHVIVFGRLRPGENGSPTPYKLSSGEYAASYEVTATEVRIIKGKDNAALTAVEETSTEEIPF